MATYIILREISEEEFEVARVLPNETAGATQQELLEAAGALPEGVYKAPIRVDNTARYALTPVMRVAPA